MSNHQKLNKLVFLFLNMGRGIVIVIVLLAVGVGAWFLFSNSSNSTGFTISGEVVESGTYDTNQGYEQFSEKISQLEKDERLYFISREDNRATLVSFEEVISGGINLNLGSNTQELEVKKEEYTTQKMALEGNGAKIIINKKEYNFQLKPDQEVYFVIKE